MAELQNAVLKTDSPTNNALQTITSAALEPQSLIAYSTPKEVPLPAMPEVIIPPILPTSQEGKASATADKIQGLNQQAVGKAAFTAEQETAAGIPALTEQEQDLGAQLSSLINESRQIPLQLQQEVAGRGVTTGGLAPLQTARLRTNAIQALGVSSMLDAVKGRLASAQMKVDRAVKAKYEPIEEEIAALTKNLDLILKDPRTSLEDKNRAEAQKLLQEKRTQAIVKKKEDMGTIMSWAAAALANGANPLVAQQLTNLAQSENPDLRAALALYAPYARDPQAVEKAVLDLELKREQIKTKKAQRAKIYDDMQPKDTPLTVAEAKELGVPYGTTRSQAAGMNLVPGSTAPEKLNVDQSKARQFATAAADANKVLAEGYAPPLLDIQGKLPNQLKTSGRQKFDQAARAFVNASLRRESGATITDSEFENKYKELINQSGDSKAVKEQKAAARAAVVRNLKEAGLMREDEEIYEVNGVKYKKGADGLYYPI